LNWENKDINKRLNPEITTKTLFSYQPLVVNSEE